MAIRFLTSVSLLIAAIALASCAALTQHANGFWVDKSQQVLVVPGMSILQVQQALGTPTQRIQYRSQPGPTFTYKVTGTIDTLFDVDFDADGKVVSTNERIIPIDGGYDRDDR